MTALRCMLRLHDWRMVGIGVNTKLICRRCGHRRWATP